MPTDLIRYDLLVQDALKGVVRRVLSNAMREGIPGEHHFYLSFRTGDKGVRISPALREKYPDEMTIVLQHQFWDLSVTEHVIEVGLYFSNVPEKLVIPFDAISGFFDPSVQFGLKFELAKDGTPTGQARPAPAPRESGEPARLPSRGASAESPKPLRKTTDKAAPKAAPDTKSVPDAGARPAASSKSADAKSADAKAAETKPDAKSGDTKKPAEEPAEGPKVISLDAFRKKT